MKFLNIRKKCSWGHEYLFINLEHLVSIEYDYEPCSITIQWGKNKKEGVGDLDLEEFDSFLTGDRKIFIINLGQDHDLAFPEESLKEQLITEKGE